MANFCCSIELEPRTLREGQLSLAREVAVDIIQKKEPKEASSMFVQALKPGSPIKEMETLSTDEDITKDKINNITGKTCQCSCASPKVDSADQSQPMQSLTAPF